MEKNKIYDIFDETLSFSGVFEKVFGSLMPKLFYNQVSENYKKALKEVYGFRDIERFFNEELLKGDVVDVMKVLFKYQDRGLSTQVDSPKNITNTIG